MARDPVKLSLSRARYGQSEAGRAAHARCARRYRAHYPEKGKAKNALNNAIASGFIVRPLVCSLPEPLNGHHGGRPVIEAHHRLGYAPEHYLDVVWVCQRCHKVLG